MVRNPVDMFHSLHSQLLYTFYENEKDFKTLGDVIIYLLKERSKKEKGGKEW